MHNIFHLRAKHSTLKAISGCFLISSLQVLTAMASPSQPPSPTPPLTASVSASPTDKTFEGLVIGKDGLGQSGSAPTVPAGGGLLYSGKASEWEIKLRNYSSAKYLGSVISLKLSDAFPIHFCGSDIFPGDIIPGQDILKITAKPNGDNATVISVSVVKIMNNPFPSFLGASAIVGCLLMLLGVGFKFYGSNEGKQCIGIFTGKDNRFSNSKTQVVAWSFLVMSSYLALIFAVKSIDRGLSIPLITIPENLGILMGISAGSFLGAKAITSSKVASGNLLKKPANSPTFSDLFTDDQANVDFGDTQMIIWSFIAMGIYVINVFSMLKAVPISSEISLPDVDSTLLVLMGVSHGTYILKKLTKSDAMPSISSVTPASGGLSSGNVNVVGSNFGPKSGRVEITNNGIKDTAPVTAWYDTLIVITLPNVSPGLGSICVITSDENSVATSYKF